jgi:hypothetical protein
MDGFARFLLRLARNRARVNYHHVRIVFCALQTTCFQLGDYAVRFNTIDFAPQVDNGKSH